MMAALNDPLGRLPTPSRGQLVGNSRTAQQIFAEAGITNLHGIPRQALTYMVKGGPLRNVSCKAGLYINHL